MAASRRLWCAIVVACAATAIGAAQSAPQRPTFRSDINYIRADVFPTMNGRHVADLQASDFEVFEDGVLQRIEGFAHIVASSPPEPDALRRDPQTVVESLDALQRTDGRVFVLFLDTNQVETEVSRVVNAPLARLLDQLLGPDDLLGVMTPDMAASDVTFSRRTAALVSVLDRNPAWGRSASLNLDARERAWQDCYPGLWRDDVNKNDDRGIASEMIARYREEMTVNALDELATYLRDVRDERKAVIVVSSGLPLFGANPALRRELYGQVPRTPNAGFDPRTGRLGQVPQAGSAGRSTQCDADRTRLANLDNAFTFRSLLDRANRSNVTFYPVDPRGLATFDAPINDGSQTGRQAQLDLVADSARLRGRQSTLRELAAATDGVAIVNSNDLEGGLKRVIGDTASYYLLGYTSTGKADGKFHAIRVHVKRPGVAVRARRGFLAPSTSELTQTPSATAGATVAASGATAPTAIGDASRVVAALAQLGTLSRSATDSVRISAAGGWKNGVARAIWVSGEWGAASEWQAGGSIDVTLAAGGGSSSVRGTLATGQRSFRIDATVGDAAATSATVRVRLIPAQGGTPVTEVLSVSLPVPGQPSTGLIRRRGPVTANRDSPAADLRFRRNEQIVVARSEPQEGTTTARLLDRSGAPMQIPLTVERTVDAEATAWIAARLALAPLAAGDYLIELGGPSGTSLTAFRVVP